MSRSNNVKRRPGNRAIVNWCRCEWCAPKARDRALEETLTVEARTEAALYDPHDWYEWWDDEDWYENEPLEGNGPLRVNLVTAARFH